jgi:antitoxin StbD
MKMAALLDRADQAVSVTAMVRGFSAKLKEISSRTTEKLVIFKDNEPAAVIINIDAYQEMLDELENLRIEAIARERLCEFDESQAISLKDMRARYAKKD